MDRVLIACDNIQLTSQMEATLRKVGYDTESISNEYNLSERLLTFNPEIVIVRGNSAKLSTLSAGRKFKDSLKFSGKIVLVFAQDVRLSPEELSKVRKDLLLFDPISSFKLALEVLKIDPTDKSALRDRLMKMAETDLHFRQQEQAYLSQHGHDFEQELIKVQGAVTQEAQGLQKVTHKSQKPKETGTIGSPEPATNEFKSALQSELATNDIELPLRIETYNHQIKDINKDLKSGLNKRQTRSQAKKINQAALKDPGAEVLADIDEEKRKFTKALFKK